ncbi:MAG: hypothetical protein WCI04_00815 [archaeon]
MPRTKAISVLKGQAGPAFTRFSRFEEMMSRAPPTLKIQYADKQISNLKNDLQLLNLQKTITPELITKKGEIQARIIHIKRLRDQAVSNFKP